MPLTDLAEPLIDKGLLPDWMLRMGIRHLLAGRVRGWSETDIETLDGAKREFINSLKKSESIAINTKEANQQHYEVPTPYFLSSLGRRLKYSSCLYPSPEFVLPSDTKAVLSALNDAEERMLACYSERADLKDGQRMLDLGCGWGSLCLYLAEHYPNSSITALSNSATQREHIESMCVQRGFKNVKVVTRDANLVTLEDLGGLTFDRIVSVEMFEHMKNYEELFRKVSSWLVPETGRLFVHVFVHREWPYHFDAGEDNSWMAKYFFTGGTMPSLDLFLHFPAHLHLLDRWSVDGRHYSLTLESWLRLMDAHHDTIMPVFETAYKESQERGDGDATAWWNRWRVFYVACSELFKYNGGSEWFVGHYLFKRAAA
ncbi:hypothetical protein HDU93_005040 [Gonapodya sp. JEL0774]|nr:hypothetical protein HDU93_005040 [Gonapodya sp. JEL0774]